MTLNRNTLSGNRVGLGACNYPLPAEYELKAVLVYIYPNRIVI